MPKKEVRVLWFSFGVAVESPGDLDEEEAAEDAADFATGVAHATGRVHESFCRVIGVHEHGYLQPESRKGSQIFNRENNWQHPTERVEGLAKKPTKAKPKKVKKKTKRI